MDYLARVEQTVNMNLDGNARVVALIEYDMDARLGYWERTYLVTWAKDTRPHQPSPDNDGLVYGTHRVNIDSKGQSALFMGHYDMTRVDAIADMIRRSGRELVR